MLGQVSAMLSFLRSVIDAHTHCVEREIKHVGSTCSHHYSHKCW